jgi:hypothetical protein
VTGSTGGGGDVWMGLSGPWMGSAGLSMDFFYLINQGGHGNRLG